MERCKGKSILIKDYIPRNINTASSHIQTLDIFVKWAISQKHTVCGSVSELSFVVRTKVWSTGTPKNPKGIIIWFNFEKAFYKSLMVANFTRKKIYKKGGREESFISEFQRHGGMHE
jgi:hypothetical protein